MSDTEGVLPGSGAHDLHDSGETLRTNSPVGPGDPWLPTAPGSRPGEQFLPPAANRTTIANGSEAKTIENPPNAIPKAPAPPVMQALDNPVLSTLDERLAAATLSGGLTALPASFGDAGGDWVTVRSDNPFEVLYFDYRLADRITPEAVSRHHEFLKRFWQDKLKSMSQGAARLAILKKYGGQHESDKLVRSYPEVIDDAYDRLSTTSRIEGVYREIVARQQNAIFARIDEKLNDFLVDLVLQPQETMALFEFSDREGLARDVVAVHVRSRISAAGLMNDRALSGATLEQQLLSSAWVHPSRKVPVQEVPVPRPRSGLVPLFLFSLAVVLVLVVGAALYSYRMKSPPPTEDGNIRAIPAVSAPQVTPKQQQLEHGTGGAIDSVSSTPRLTANNGTPPAPMSPPIEKPRPQPEDPVTDTQPAVSMEERKAVQDELEEIRTLTPAESSAALERARRLELTLSAHPQEFAGERVELADLRDQIQAAVMEAKIVEERRRIQEESHTKEWEQRLAQIESLSKQGNFSGAKSLADQLLSEQDLPESVATRARKMADEAVSKLQAIFSGAKVKSRTKRSSDPPQ
jgi:hypothetical protein